MRGKGPNCLGCGEGIRVLEAIVCFTVILTVFTLNC